MEKLKALFLIIIGLIFLVGIAISTSHSKFFLDDASADGYHIFSSTDNLIPAILTMESQGTGGILVLHENNFYAITESIGSYEFEVYRTINNNIEFEAYWCARPWTIPIIGDSDYTVPGDNITNNNLKISDIVGACTPKLGSKLYRYSVDLKPQILKIKDAINEKYGFVSELVPVVTPPVDPTDPVPVVTTPTVDETCSISVASNTREFFLANTLGHPDYPAGLHPDDFKSGTYLVKTGSSYRRHPSSVSVSGENIIAKFDDLECGATYKFYWDFDTPNGRIYFKNNETGYNFYTITVIITADSGTDIDGSFGSKHKVVVGAENNLCSFGLRVADSSVGENKLEENFENIIIRTRDAVQVNRDYSVQSSYRDSTGLSYVFTLLEDDYYFTENVSGKNKRFPSSGFLRVKENDGRCSFFKVA